MLGAGPSGPRGGAAASAPPGSGRAPSLAGAVASGLPRRAAGTSRVRHDGGAGERRQGDRDGRVSVPGSLPPGGPCPEDSLSSVRPRAGLRAVSQPVPLRR